MTLQDINVKFIIWSGFGAIIALMLILGVFMVHKLNQQVNQFNNVVKVNNSKVHIVHDMRDTIRLRSLSLNKMALSDDIFTRDDENIIFMLLAKRFVREFEKFKQFELNENETKLISLLQSEINIAFPLNKKALQMLLNDDEVKIIKPIIITALSAQEEILSTLDELSDLQQRYAEKSLILTEESMDNMITLLVFIVSVSIIFSIIVSQAVSKIVSDKNSELSKATEVKSMFLANMSHEIRTPLTAIIGFAKSQMIPNLPEDHNERATKIILRNSEHLLTIINDILDFSKIEANKLEFDFTDFSLFNLLDDVKSSLTGLMGEKELKFTINYNYPLPEIINTDKTRLHQILINLGGNAIKFTEEGFININIRYVHLENAIYFDVNDSGIGMSQEQQQWVFHNFSQADITTTRKYGGTGLGLTISSELIHKLGGELTLTSETGVGSTFSFKIENKIGDSNSSIKLINNPGDPNESRGGLVRIINHHQVDGTILLVEDMPDNQELITFHLEEMGANVTTVNNGKEAVSITDKKEFDLILMDMQMPIMGGVEATRLIRARGDISPIVMLTANAAQEYKQKSLDVGCDDFLLKPLNENELLTIVKKYLVDNEKIIRSHGITETANEVIQGDSDMILSTLLKKDAKKYDKFVNKFINYLPTYVDEISENIKIKNDIELKVVTHKLKGIGGSMGFKILTDISVEFEIAIKQGNRKEISRLFNELKATAQKIYRGKDTFAEKNTA